MSNIKVGSYVRCVRGYGHIQTGTIGRVTEIGKESVLDDQYPHRQRTNIIQLDDKSGGHYASRFVYLGDGVQGRRHKRIYPGDVVVVKGFNHPGTVKGRAMQFIDLNGNVPREGAWEVDFNGSVLIALTSDLLVVSPVVRK